MISDDISGRLELPSAGNVEIRIARAGHLKALTR
jgi:hypothetical protein